MIAITDHNEIRGTLQAFDLAPKYDILALLGAELFFMSQDKLSELLVYFRKKDEIIGFMQEFRKDKFVPDFLTVAPLIKMVRKYNGVCIAPHPYGHKGLLGHGEEGNFDGIERVNSFISPKDNEQVREYQATNAGRYKSFGGADMHIFPSALSAAYTELTSEEKIDLESFWQNMACQKNNIVFKASGKSLSLTRRASQELWCLVKVTCYLIYQDVGFLRLHTFHNFKQHHRG